MATEQVQYVITAVDRTRAAFAQISGSFTKLQAGAMSVKSAFAGLAAIGALGGVGASLQASIRQLDDFNDAADKTGASVESLSAILNTLGSTGASLEQVTDIAGKLIRAMSAAGEGSSRAGEAFAKLGISTRDTAGNLRPVEDVLFDVAKAFDQYRDGSNKTALAQDLFGKSGADLLPLLKDLATEQRRGATVTTEMAENADKAQKAVNRLTFEMQTMRTELAASLLPGLTEFLAKLRSIAAISANPIKWGEYLFGSASDINAEVSRIESEIKRLEGIVDGTVPVDRGANQRDPKAPVVKWIEDLIGDPSGQAKARQRLLQLQRDLQEAKAVQRAQRELGVATAQPPRSGRAMLFDNTGYGPAPDKPDAPGGGGGGAASARAREQQSQAERLLQTLTQQLDKTRELSVEQEILAQIGRGEIQGLTPALEQQILLRAAQIDRLKAETKAREELQDVIDEMAKAEAIEASTKAAALSPDAEQFRLAGEAATRAWREYQSMLEASTEKVAAHKQQVMDFINVQLELGKISDTTAEELKKRLLEVPAATQEASNAARDLGLTFQSAFEDAIIEGKALSDVLKALLQDLGRMFIRKAVTEPLANMAAGAFGDLFKGFGGARAMGGPVSAGTAYLVGERGPELFVPKVGGSIVPNGATGGIVQNITVSGEVGRTDIANAVAIAVAQAKSEIRASMMRRGAFAG